MCGQDHSLFRTKKGDVFACGWGADGQTGRSSACYIHPFTEMQALNSELKLPCMYGWKGAAVFPAVCRYSQYSCVATERQSIQFISQVPCCQSQHAVWGGCVCCLKLEGRLSGSGMWKLAPCFRADFLCFVILISASFASWFGLTEIFGCSCCLSVGSLARPLFWWLLLAEDFLWAFPAV